VVISSSRSRSSSTMRMGGVGACIFRLVVVGEDADEEEADEDPDESPEYDNLLAIRDDTRREGGDGADWLVFVVIVICC
jgi:hypothetical protein